LSNRDKAGKVLNHRTELLYRKSGFESLKTEQPQLSLRTRKKGGVEERTGQSDSVSGGRWLGVFLYDGRSLQKKGARKEYAEKILMGEGGELRMLLTGAPGILRANMLRGGEGQRK